MLESTKERVANLPESVKQCCGEEMNIRRSSLRENPCADDVTLKCTNCYRIQTHGIPISRETYEKELAERDGRTVDAVDIDPNKNLQALGYIDY